MEKGKISIFHGAKSGTSGSSGISGTSESITDLNIK